MSILEGLIKPTIHIDPTVNTDIDMSSTTNNHTYNISIGNLIVVTDKATAEEVLGTMVKRPSVPVQESEPTAADATP